MECSPAGWRCGDDRRNGLALTHCTVVGSDNDETSDRPRLRRERLAFRATCRRETSTRTCSRRYAEVPVLTEPHVPENGGTGMWIHWRIEPGANAAGRMG